MVNRVSEPLVRSELAVTLEVKFCLSDFNKEIERQKGRFIISTYKYNFNFHVFS